MLEKQRPLVSKSQEDLLKLKNKIKTLEQELDKLEAENFAFENFLRIQLEKEIIEEQELTILYKRLKKAKKEKRLSQKNKGKKLKEEVLKSNLNTSKNNPPKKETSLEDSKEKKRLYREAMLQVHPDKFSMKEGEEEMATEVTTKLIEIYKNEDLESLQDYHAHIFSGNALLEIQEPKAEKSIELGLSYLKKEIKHLEQALKDLKEKHTYIVWTTYKDPYSFVKELKAYYDDRLFKLRKRTRKA